MEKTVSSFFVFVTINVLYFEQTLELVAVELFLFGVKWVRARPEDILPQAMLNVLSVFHKKRSGVQIKTLLVKIRTLWHTRVNCYKPCG